MTLGPAASIKRNPTLDFIRGLALIIIFINHIPFNPWYWATPSRFGLSDATEIFVFLSGFVAALAYGKRLQREGLISCTGHVCWRIVQIYIAHLLMFTALLFLCWKGTSLIESQNYIENLNLIYPFTFPYDAALGFLTLTYVPNYFDILPIYIFFMATIPLMLFLTRLNKLALLLPVILYFIACACHWELPAEIVGERSWFFNPFCWQLIFYIGFAFGTGHLRISSTNPFLLVLCVLAVVAAAILEFGATYFGISTLDIWRNSLVAWVNKSHLGLLRLLHFLALAYVVNRLIPCKPVKWLLESRFAYQIALIGKHSLTLFVIGMIGAYACGMALDVFGRDAFSVALINLVGLTGLFLCALGIELFSSGYSFMRIMSNLVLSRASISCFIKALITTPLILCLREAQLKFRGATS